MAEPRDAALTDLGRAEVETLAHRNGVGADAVVALLQALRRGGGDQAQFSHPDLGGMGQWSRHGMIMIGDMFNDALKVRVDQLCRETAALLDAPGLVAERRDATGREDAWWPDGLGQPSARGAQNDMRYACFPAARRIAIDRDGHVEIYDSGEHRILGVSQQQGSAADVRFTSQLGTVNLHELTRTDGPRVDAIAPTAATAAPAAAGPKTAPPSSLDPVDLLERLHALHGKGVLSDAEFAEKKRELLARL